MVRENYLILPEEPSLSDDEYENTSFNDIMNEINQQKAEDYQRLSEDQHDEPEQSPIQTEQATLTISSNNQPD